MEVIFVALADKHNEILSVTFKSTVLLTTELLVKLLEQAPEEISALTGEWISDTLILTVRRCTSRPHNL
jgi:hypothetical protein